MNWPRFMGTPSGRPVVYTRRVLERFGCSVDLHKFVAPDDLGCFHTHPAYHLRIVARGGYVEELEDGRRIAWRAGDIGLVRPSTSHRIDALLYGQPAYTLWISGPTIAKVELRGSGWPTGTPWKCRPCGAYGIAKEALLTDACPYCGAAL